MPSPKVKLYSLTTCAFCTAIKKMLADLEVDHDFIDADMLPDKEKEELLDELGKINPRCSFPTLLIDEKVITGYMVQEIKETLGIRTEVDELYDNLKKIQEPRGYCFNANREKTFELLRALLTNKDRYGYMACPCRLASSKRQKDKDIICPCEYREADIKEYGSCYCELYVTDDWNTGKITRMLVPDRRPVRR
ncbi:MAG: glutaredoxin [Desulfobulbaceae bacterium]|nr:glutaredoxin [Desulfobulbaceae bacterium]